MLEHCCRDFITISLSLSFYLLHSPFYVSFHYLTFCSFFINRGNLNLTLLPTSEMRIAFIGDDGYTERLSTLSSISQCSAVAIEEIPADNSGRSFLIKIPDCEVLYFWCSEKSKLLGIELLAKVNLLGYSVCGQCIRPWKRTVMRSMEALHPWKSPLFLNTPLFSIVGSFFGSVSNGEILSRKWICKQTPLEYVLSHSLPWIGSFPQALKSSYHVFALGRALSLLSTPFPIQITK